MSVEHFLVQPPSNILINIVIVAVAVFGVVFVIVGFSSRLLNALNNVSMRGHLGNRYIFVIIGVAAIVLSGVMLSSTQDASTITVGSGYINVQFSHISPDAPYVPFVSGNKNVTSSEISSAFVGQAGSGDFTLTKQYGTDYGDTNIGVYTLGNHATAYVASTNSTNLILQLNNGKYLILGTADTDALATSFSENVYELTAP